MLRAVTMMMGMCSLFVICRQTSRPDMSGSCVVALLFEAVSQQLRDGRIVFHDQDFIRTHVVISTFLHYRQYTTVL